ncbi:MAG: hypothetical protein ACI9TH_001481 [Kiritimatiellia bacterium]|jgi:hypothetical protein
MNAEESEMNDEQPEIPQDPPNRPIETPSIKSVPMIDPPEPAQGNDCFEKLEGAKSPVALLEAVLKTPKRLFTEILNGDLKAVSVGTLVLTVACLLVYGLITGCFSMGTQLWASPLKIALGTLISAFICLPSLYIFACLAQVEVRISEVVAFLLAMLSLVSIILLGLAPVLFVFTVSTESVIFMGIMHLLFWGIGIVFGIRFLVAMFRYLRGRSFGYLTLWTFIFTLVLLQMSTTLRPIIGESDHFLSREKRFFLVHWTNQISGKDRAERFESPSK